MPAHTQRPSTAGVNWRAVLDPAARAARPAMVDAGRCRSRAMLCNPANCSSVNRRLNIRLARFGSLMVVPRRVRARGIGLERPSILPGDTSRPLVKLLRHHRPPSGRWPGPGHWPATRSSHATRRPDRGTRSRPALARASLSSPRSLAPAPREDEFGDTPSTCTSAITGSGPGRPLRNSTTYSTMGACRQLLGSSPKCAPTRATFGTHTWPRCASTTSAPPEQQAGRMPCSGHRGQATDE